MPILYTSIPLATNGMVCARRFDVPIDGRRVFFDLTPDGSFRKDIFLMMDQKLREKPFVNGSRIETPVCGLERLLADVHEGFAIVVDRTEVALAPISLPAITIPVVFSSGHAGTIRLQGTLTARIFPADPGLLAQCYADGEISDPCSAAAGQLKLAVQQAASTVIPAAMGRTTPMDAIGAVQSLSLELAWYAARETQRQLPWCRVTNCEIALAVENLDEIITKSNFLTDLDIEAKRRILDAIVNTFGTSPLPLEAAQVLQHYIMTNPGLTGSEFHDVCQCVHALWARGGTDMLVLAANQAGILLPGKGGAGNAVS